MKVKIYEGFIAERNVGEYEDALFIGDTDYPIAEVFMDELQDKNVTVRYWTSDVQKSKEQIQEGVLKSIVGCVEADYNDKYSEYTGYLWTDEELNIGGHNLLEELRSNKGKYIILEVEVH